MGTIGSMMSLILMIPFGMLTDKYGRRPIIIFSRLSGLLALLIETLATTSMHLIIAVVVGSFAAGSFFPTILSRLGDTTKPEERQEAMSTFYFFSSSGMLLGPIISILLLTITNITLRNIFQIGLVAETCFFIYLVTRIRETQTPTEDANQTDFLNSFAI